MCLCVTRGIEGALRSRGGGYCVKGFIAIPERGCRPRPPYLYTLDGAVVSLGGGPEEFKEWGLAFLCAGLRSNALGDRGPQVLRGFKWDHEDGGIAIWLTIRWTGGG